jgi:uncharacterized protein (TIGR02217 family)
VSGFHDVTFPFAPGFGARGGPERLTEVVELASGREERNSPWADSRRRWDAGPGMRSADDLAGLVAFFEARRGRLYAFRFRDPLDHRSCAPSGEPGPGDQLIGTGDGTRTVFPLIKRYGAGPDAYERAIALPVPGTVRVAVDGVEAAVSVEGGAAVLDFAPEAGAAVTAGYLFDTPVRFDTDRLELALDAFEAGQAASVPLIEVRLQAGHI